MKHGVKHLHFFNWFYNTITYAIIVAIYKMYNMFYEDDAHQGPQHDHHHDKCISWGDSNMYYLQQMANPTKIEDIMNNVIYYSKVGAKITAPSQPLDSEIQHLLDQYLI